MTAQEIAKVVIKTSGKTLNDLANECGKASPANIGMYLQSKNMRVDNLQMILNACGYDLIVMSRDRTKPDYAIGAGVLPRSGESPNDAYIRMLIKETVSEELNKRENPGPDIPVFELD